VFEVKLRFVFFWFCRMCSSPVVFKVVFLELAASFDGDIWCSVVTMLGLYRVIYDKWQRIRSFAFEGPTHQSCRVLLSTANRVLISHKRKESWELSLCMIFTYIILFYSCFIFYFCSISWILTRENLRCQVEAETATPFLDVYCLKLSTFYGAGKTEVCVLL
jgi:hypothetical protein